MNIFFNRKIYIFLHIFVNKILYGLGYKINKIIDEESLLVFLDRLKVEKNNHKLIRIGGKADGGYFVPDDLIGISSCFTAGIGDEISFEYNLAEKGIKCFMADYSVEMPPLSHNNFFFIKKFIGNQNSCKYIKFFEWVEKNRDDYDHILKLDIEGDEYDVLSTITKDHLLKMRIIVFEIHNFSQIINPLVFRLIKLIFDKLQENHSIVYINKNPIFPSIKFSKKLELHDLLEITLIRNDRLNQN